MNKDVRIDVDDNCKLRTLTQSDVKEKYIAWLNDYEIMKYTEQKYFDHSFSSVSEFIAQKYDSKANTRETKCRIKLSQG